MDADGNNPAPASQPVNLKIENVKIPDVHGVPSKDSTTAQSLIQRINNLSQANNWDTTVSFHHFAIGLKSSAWKWLEWQMLCVDGATASWEWIKPRFREEFAMQWDDANILNQLSHLKMKHDENVSDLYSRVFDASLAQQKLVKHRSQHQMEKVSTWNSNYATLARSVTIFTQIMFKCSYSNMPFWSISNWQSILQSQKT